MTMLRKGKKTCETSETGHEFIPKNIEYSKWNMAAKLGVPLGISWECVWCGQKEFTTEIIPTDSFEWICDIREKRNDARRILETT